MIAIIAMIAMITKNVFFPLNPHQNVNEYLVGRIRWAGWAPQMISTQNGQIKICI